MTYPPGNPGYPPAQPSGSYASSSPSFTKAEDTESKLPVYLQIAVAVLGFGVYLGNFGPLLSIADSEYPMFLGDTGYTVPLAVVAALLAAVGLLPKAKVYTPIIAVLATLGALLVIHTSLGSGDNSSIGWGLWLVLSFSVLQAIVALGALLLESGVISAPTPRAKYDPYAGYGLPPGGGYYGQSGQAGQSGHSGTPQLFGQQSSQPSGYPSYGGYPTGPTSGGFSAPSAPQSGGFGSAPAPAANPSGPSSTPPPVPQGPPTPPTGFPSFSPPPGSGAAGGASGQQAQGGSAPSGPTQS